MFLVSFAVETVSLRNLQGEHLKGGSENRTEIMLQMANVGFLDYPSPARADATTVSVVAAPCLSILSLASAGQVLAGWAGNAMAARSVTRRQASVLKVTCWRAQIG